MGWRWLFLHCSLEQVKNRLRSLDSWLIFYSTAPYAIGTGRKAFSILSLFHWQMWDEHYLLVPPDQTFTLLLRPQGGITLFTTYFLGTKNISLRMLLPKNSILVEKDSCVVAFHNNTLLLSSRQRSFLIDLPYPPTLHLLLPLHTFMSYLIN